QSYTGLILCSYPAGFVEPRPEFWQRMRNMALRTRALSESLPFFGTVQVEVRDCGCSSLQAVAFRTVQTHRPAFLQPFPGHMSSLQSISEKELRREPLSAAETLFLKDLIHRHDDHYYGIKQYSGWYPGLFYRNIFQQVPPTEFQGSDIWDALVTDVHSDAP